MKKLIFCEVFKDFLENMDIPEDMEVEYIKKELHRFPEKLHTEIKKVFAETSGYEMIILGFGLCGNALNDIKVPDCPLVMPKVHDCVPVFLGSKSFYEDIHKENPRTLYYMYGAEFLKEEIERTCNKYGEKKAKCIYDMMFKNYERFLYIHNDQPEDMEILKEAQDISAFLDLPCDEIAGSMIYLEKLLYGPWDEEEFLTIPPNEVIRMESFLSRSR